MMLGEGGLYKVFIPGCGTDGLQCPVWLSLCNKSRFWKPSWFGLKPHAKASQHKAMLGSPDSQPQIETHCQASQLLAPASYPL